MTYRVAAATFSVGNISIMNRVTGQTGMDAPVGPPTVLTGEENVHLDVVLWAAHRHLGLSRAQLLEGIRNLCCDGRCVPWGHTGPGRKRLDPFFEGHAWLAERRCSIYKANTGTTDNESRLREIYSKWIELVERLKRETDHVRNTDDSPLRV